MTRHLTIALYLFVIALASLLLFPANAAANWDSNPVPPITTTDAATVNFWNACSTLAVDTVTAYPSADVISWIDWYSVETNAPGTIPFCVVAQVAPPIGPDSPDAPAQEILALSIRFYRGQPGEIDAAYILARIHAGGE